MKELSIVAIVCVIAFAVIFIVTDFLTLSQTHNEQTDQIYEQISQAGMFRTKDGTRWIVSRAPGRD